MPFVVDTSITLAWCIDAEATPATEAVLVRLRDGGAWVPAIWPLEVANALLAAERRQRLTRSQVAGSLRLLGNLPITIDETDRGLAWGSVLTTAREQGLSTYDASFVDLASRRGLPLATLDTAMRDAARRLGVSLLDGA